MLMAGVSFVGLGQGAAGGGHQGRGIAVEGSMPAYNGEPDDETGSGYQAGSAGPLRSAGGHAMAAKGAPEKSNAPVSTPACAPACRRALPPRVPGIKFRRDGRRHICFNGTGGAAPGGFTGYETVTIYAKPDGGDTTCTLGARFGIRSLKLEWKMGTISSSSTAILPWR